MRIIKNCEMKNYSNMKIGGKATLIFVESKDELSEIYKNYKNIFILGNGTNTLIDDDDLDVVFVSLKNLNGIKKIDNNTIQVGAGLDFGKFIVYMNKNNLSGLENLAGIPGTLGGLVYMNGGAYGSEIFDCIESIEILDENKKIREIKKEEIKYTYRHTEIQDKGWAILSVNFKFTDGFDREKVKEIQKLRESRQPLTVPNLGSTFKNPNGDFSARLIAESNLMGHRIGGIEISTKHPNFLVNNGNGTFKDVLNMVQFIQEKILKEHNVKLVREIIIVDKTGSRL